MRILFVPTVCSLFLAYALLPVAAMSQRAASSSDQRQNETSVEGTVVSATRDSLVVRTDDNHFQLFTFDRETMRPPSIPRGARVRVSSGSEEAGAQLARTVTILEATKAEGERSAAETQPIPRELRDLERDIKRQARRWRLGVRAGAALDPELLLFGVHSQLGPVFHRNIFFRPNAEFAFGEVTDLVALNLEVVYRLPMTSRRAGWSPYLGAGPGLTFLHQNFQRGRDIDFGNFVYDTGFNILAGVQFRRGTFVELKTSIYSRPAPTLRLIFGYTF